MKINGNPTPKKIYGLMLCLLSLLLAGCSKNYHEYEAIFYPSSNKLTNYRKIVVINNKRGTFANLMLENALKAKLTEIIPGNVQAVKSITEIGKDLSMLRYTPKLDMLDLKKIAYLSFNVSAKGSVKRTKKSEVVHLKQCNYLKKKNKCTRSQVARLLSGEQSVQLIFTGEIHLKNSSGLSILPPSPFRVVMSDKGQVVLSSLSLTRAASNRVASDYISQIIPFKKNVKIQLLDDGDEIAVMMIQNRAYNMAINRLDQIVTNNNEDPTADDYYHLGIAYEALNEVAAATRSYEKAQNLSPEEPNIRKALNRTKNIKSH